MSTSPETPGTPMSDLTLEEKVRCCALYQDRFANLTRLGTAYRCSDNPSGGTCDYLPRDRETRMREQDFWGTCFPQTAVLGASWDPDLARAVGEAMGRECRARQISILLRPGVNLKRSPLCGRNFEYPSEDPWLSSEIAAAFIRGVQSQGVAACLKHYLCNSQEYERMTTSAVVDERTLHELYLRVFQLTLQKCHPWTLMTSYNRVNGQWVHQSGELMGILRKDFGYDGLIMSDAFAIHTREDKIAGHRNGLDVELAEEDNHVHLLWDAVSRGEIPEETLDSIAGHVLACRERTCRGEDAPVPQVDQAAHHVLARRAAQEGAVLLKNDGLLPLEPGRTGTLAVIGAAAAQPCYMGGGSGHMNGATLDIPLEEIRALPGLEQVAYAPGYSFGTGCPPTDSPRPDLVAQAVETARQADVILFFAGDPPGAESEGYDRRDLLLPESQRNLLDAVLAVSQNLILVVNTGAPVDLSAFTDRVRAILEGGFAGEGAGGASVDILFGRAEPGGRLPETWPLRLEDTPSYLSFPAWPDVMPDVVYGEGIYIGYRWYDARRMEVAWPFGYGLSYTTFQYSDLRLDRTELDGEDTVTVSFRVRNTGTRAGSDVAQVYVHDPESVMNRPEKELRGFRKVHLQPGEEQEVSIPLDRRAWEYYTPALHRWVVEEGEYRILVGRSSRDILLEAAVTVRSRDTVRHFDSGTPIGHFVKDPRFRSVLAGEEEAVRTTFDPRTNPLLPLVMAIPFGQFADLDLGQGKLSQHTIQKIVAAMNRQEPSEPDSSPASGGGH